MQEPVILGIETSCDETACGIVRGGRTLLANEIASQIALHRPYGGVVPELAARSHLEALLPVIEGALRTAGLNWSQIDAIAVTRGPGLIGALLVGVCGAKALAYAHGLPLVGVNHLAGHIAANWLTAVEPVLPAVCLVVSGAHSDLYLVESQAPPRVRLLGASRDDAAGEAYDKVARLLELPYPGGPALDKLAQGGDPAAIAFPRALVGQGFEFSFSGLKTAVAVYLESVMRQGKPVNRADVAASFQAAVVDVLVEKTLRAAQATGARQVLLAGGVAANSALRRAMAEACARADLPLGVPAPALCTDNGAMIAAAGGFAFMAGERSPLDLDVDPNLRLTPGGIDRS